jgi:hypothetical protein
MTSEDIRAAIARTHAPDITANIRGTISTSLSIAAPVAVLIGYILDISYDVVSVDDISVSPSDITEIFVVRGLLVITYAIFWYYRPESVLKRIDRGGSNATTRTTASYYNCINLVSD